MASTGGY